MNNLLLNTLGGSCHKRGLLQLPGLGRVPRLEGDFNISRKTRRLMQEAQQLSEIPVNLKRRALCSAGTAVATGLTGPGTWTPAVASRTDTSRAKRRRIWKLSKWRPADRHRDCGCQPYNAARTIITRGLGPKAWG